MLVGLIGCPGAAFSGGDGGAGQLMSRPPVGFWASDTGPLLVNSSDSGKGF